MNRYGNIKPAFNLEVDYGRSDLVRAVLKRCGGYKYVGPASKEKKVYAASLVWIIGGRPLKNFRALRWWFSTQGVRMLEALASEVFRKIYPPSGSVIFGASGFQDWHGSQPDGLSLYQVGDVWKERFFWTHYQLDERFFYIHCFVVEVLPSGR